MYLANEKGIKTNCNFLIRTIKKTECRALREFYNAEDENNLCRNCPFFKTREAFLAGFRKRGRSADEEIYAEII